MAVVKAKVRLEGFEGSREGLALVDTGASITLLDEEVASSIGVEATKMERMLVTASGHKVKGRIGILKRLMLEGEELPYAYVLLTKIPRQVAEVLEREGLVGWLVLGVTALELAGYVADPITGTLKKSELFLI